MVGINHTLIKGCLFMYIVEFRQLGDGRAESGDVSQV